MEDNLIFDSEYNVAEPTIILTTRNGRKIGSLRASNITFKKTMLDGSELSFDVYKNDNLHIWDDIVDFRLVLVDEWKSYFEITVETTDSSGIKKIVSAKSLGEQELSQINVYGLEINTEDDINRDDYEPTVFYNADPKKSLLHKLLLKAPHYSIGHVDSELCSVQRSFSFDGKSIRDAFLEISEELECIITINVYCDTDYNMHRMVNAYLLDSYGKDTGIFVSSKNLSDEITLKSDPGSVKNCFRLEAGDDLMTATVASLNPNGSQYIWNCSNIINSDISKELRNKIELYFIDYDKYKNEYVVDIDEETINSYNELIKKYSDYDSDLQEITFGIAGYSGLVEAYYNTIDFNLFLTHSLMPSAEISDTSSIEEAKKIKDGHFDSVSVQDIGKSSKSTIDNAVLSTIKAVVDNRFSVKINESTYSNLIWAGNVTITNYSDEKDSTTVSLQYAINDNYEEFTKQKVEKILKKKITENFEDSLSELFLKNDSDFAIELKKYGLNSLKAFGDCCQSVIDILIELGIADNAENGMEKLYSEMYEPYYNKLEIINGELLIREREIDVVKSLQAAIDSERNKIQNILNFESYVGNDLFSELSAYRRDDIYKNENYISDGLSNSELFKRASEFFDVATEEISKSSSMQYSISTNLKNLLVLEPFKKLSSNFDVGNWIRIEIDDKIFKLRLNSFQISFTDLSSIQVDFSDVSISKDSTNKIRDLLDKASSMATSFGYVSRQAKLGAETNEKISDWRENGFAATYSKFMNSQTDQTQIWDSHGMLFRKYNQDEESYDPSQLKIVNSTIAFTDDNWKSVKTAIGEINYYNPDTNNFEKTYGINADTLVGRIILGENLRIYNNSGNLSFNDDGLKISNGNNTFSVDPNSDRLLRISDDEKDVFFVDRTGRLYINADGTEIDVSKNQDFVDVKSYTTTNRTNIINEINRAKNEEKKLESSISNISGRIAKITDRTSLLEETIFSFKNENDIYCKLDIRDFYDDEENIEELNDSAVSVLNNIRIFQHTIIDEYENESREMFIVNEDYPRDLVYFDSNGNYCVRTNNLLLYLIKAIKELSANMKV